MHDNYYEQTTTELDEQAKLVPAVIGECNLSNDGENISATVRKSMYNYQQDGINTKDVVDKHNFINNNPLYVETRFLPYSFELNCKGITFLVGAYNIKTDGKTFNRPSKVFIHLSGFTKHSEYLDKKGNIRKGASPTVEILVKAFLFQKGLMQFLPSFTPIHISPNTSYTQKGKGRYKVDEGYFINETPYNIEEVKKIKKLCHTKECLTDEIEGGRYVDISNNIIKYNRDLVVKEAYKWGEKMSKKNPMKLLKLFKKVKNSDSSKRKGK